MSEVLLTIVEMMDRIFDHVQENRRDINKLKVALEGKGEGQ